MKTAAKTLSSAAVIVVVLSTPTFAQDRPRTDAPKGDRLWNGLLIGGVAGTAAAWVFLRANCGPAGYDSECAAIAGPVGFVTFVPAGIVAGALIDKAIKKDTIAVAPSRRGVRVLWTRRF